MANSNGPDETFIANLVEAALRIGLLLLLLIWSFDIIRPFLMPILWAGILAISFMPLVQKLESLMGGRRGWAATSSADMLIARVR